MIFIPAILLLNMIVNVLTFPLTLLSFALPDAFVEAIVSLIEPILVFSGVFPVGDLLLASGLMLSAYVVLIIIRLTFMGLNMIPGVNLKSPYESYISSASSTNTDGKVVVRTVHESKRVNYDR